MTARRRLAAIVVTAAVCGLLAGCQSGAPSQLDPHGSSAEHINGDWWLMFWLAAGVFVVVGGLLLYGAFRRPSEDEHRGRTGFNEHKFIAVGGVLIPTLILGVLAVDTVRTTRLLDVASRPDEEQVEVVGYQYWWGVSYPKEGVVTANEIHIPVDRPIDVGLTSADVIHTFWVPQLAGKLDMIPGQHNELRFTAHRVGVYRGECSQFCGLQHAHMDFLVFVDTPADFAAWVAHNATSAPTPTDPEQLLGEQVFTREACAGCHTIRGTSAAGIRAPDLTHFGSRTTIGAGTVPNTAGNLGGWISNSQTIKPGDLMPPITLEPGELNALIAYLEGQK